MGGFGIQSPGFHQEHTLDRRIQFYEDEIRKLSEQRLMPIWNFCNFFILKESLAFMFEMAHLHEDSLREYDELELCYLETVNMPGKQRDFGGMDRGDDQAALLSPGNKPLTQIVQDDSFREFEFRQYLFACQAKGGGKDGANKCSEPESAPSTNVVTSLPETETAHTIASTSLSETKSAGKGTSSLPKTERSCNLDSFSINETERAYNVASAFLADVKNDRAPNITCSIESQKILSTTSHLVHCNSNAAESSNDDVMDGADPGNN